MATLLLQPIRDSKPSFQPQKRLSKDEVDQLVHDYENGDGSIYMLAERYGIHRQTISKILKDRGLILGRTSLSNEESTAVIELFAAGHSPSKIGRQLSRDPKSVRAILRSKGLLHS